MRRRRPTPEQTLFVPECRHPKSGQLEMSRSSIHRPCTKISNRSRMRNAKMDVAEACCDDIPSHFPSGCFS
jgi:hypothetical protein